jgi:hypothetical protein
MVDFFGRCFRSRRYLAWENLAQLQRLSFVKQKKPHSEILFFSFLTRGHHFTLSKPEANAETVNGSTNQADLFTDGIFLRTTIS